MRLCRWFTFKAMTKCYVCKQKGDFLSISPFWARTAHRTGRASEQNMCSPPSLKVEPGNPWVHTFRDASFSKKLAKVPRGNHAFPWLSCGCLLLLCRLEPHSSSWGAQVPKPESIWNRLLSKREINRGLVFPLKCLSKAASHLLSFKIF